MRDYKYLCNWRQYKLKQTRRNRIYAGCVIVFAVLMYGFVGHLERDTVPVETIGQCSGEEVSR